MEASSNCGAVQTVPAGPGFRQSLCRRSAIHRCAPVEIAAAHVAIATFSAKLVIYEARVEREGPYRAARCQSRGKRRV